MAKKQISVLVDEEILMLIDVEAERFERSRNWVINKRLGYFIHTGFDPKWEVLHGGEVWEEPAKKIANISAGGGGDSSLPRGGKAQDTLENPYAYGAELLLDNYRAIGKAMTEIWPGKLTAPGREEATDCVTEERWTESAAPDIETEITTVELGDMGQRLFGKIPVRRVSLSDNIQFVYDFPNSGKIPGTEVVIPQKNRLESEPDYCECDPQPREWFMTNPPTCGICGGYKNDSAPAASWSDWNKVLDSGEKINPETLAEIKNAAAVDFSLARKVHQKGIELDRDILVRWGLESVDGVEGRAKTRKTAGVAGRSAKAVKAGNDVAKSSAVGDGARVGVDIQVLRDICAGNIPVAAVLPSGPIEVDLCGFESYNETDGENYVCGKEKHGPKVKHGEWIQI